MAGRMAATLRRGLSELGYIDGQTIAVEVRIAEGRSERIDELVSELIGLKVDVLVTGSSPGALAAKKATAPFPSLWSRPIPLGLDWWQVWRDQAET